LRNFSTLLLPGTVFNFAKVFSSRFEVETRFKMNGFFYL